MTEKAFRPDRPIPFKERSFAGGGNAGREGRAVVSYGDTVARPSHPADGL